MNRKVVFVVLVVGWLCTFSPMTQAEPWPGWRGPRGDGTCIEQGVPVDWDPAGALWKTELPGQGHASPIVWGDRVYTVTGNPATRDRILLCLDRRSGKILWQQTVVKGPLEKLHKENSYASSTPFTDGKRVYVTFRDGDEIFVAAHDLATGRQLWRFHTVAQVDEPGGDTWGDTADMFRKGGETWITGSYDPDLDLTFWGVAQPKPWVAASRS